MTSQGNAYSRFRRALESGDLRHVRLAAAELPQINLSDALQVCLVMREHPSYERAVVRWLGRLATEVPGLTRPDLDVALDALEQLRDAPDVAMQQLSELCRRLRVL